MARNLINLTLLVVLANPVFAATSVTNKWTGTDSNSWNQSTNWDLGRIPNYVNDSTYKGDYVWINYVPTRPEGCVINGSDCEAYNVNVMREGIDDSSVRAILNLKSGSLTVKGWELKLGMGTYGYYVAHPAQPYSVVNMYQGFTLNITGTGGLTVGDYYDGEFNMYGGVYNHNAGGFRIGNSAYNGGLGYGKGILNLYGGRININVWNSGTNRADIRDFTPESEINIGDGNMALVGNNISFLQDSINQGFIKAISPRNLIIEFDENVGTMGTTYIRAEIPTKAFNPTPANMAVEVSHVGTILSWQPAVGTVRHKIYFGLSESTLALIGETDAPTNSLSLPLLDYGKQYFWRVDEVNSGGSVTQGYIWKFTVSDGIVVDLLEDYNDTYPVSNKWSSLGGGSISLETDTAFDNVYEGDQSLKLDYYNSNSYSEAVYTYSSASDWAAYNIKSLSIAVHGKATNGKDFLYAIVEDSTGALSNPVIYGNDPCSIIQTMYSPWIIFNIDIADFGTSVNISQIKKLHIGIGNRINLNTTSSGLVHIDYIKLFPSRCLKNAAGADLNRDCFVNLMDFVEFASQWLTGASPVQPHKEPILKYDFEDTSDAYTAIDAAGDFNGAIVGDGYGYYDIKEGRNAYLFLGLYGDAGISIPSGAFTGFDNQITISLWAYGDPDQLLRHTYAFKFALAGGNTLFGTLPSSGGYIYNLMGLSSDNIVYHPMSASAYSGSWAHWAFTRDFSTGEMSIYRNGIEVASKSDASIATSVFSSVAYAWVGARELVGDVTKPDTSYCGWIDDFEIYDYALSEKEIIYLANQTFNADLEADFDNSNQIDFKDLSELANNWLKQILWP